MVQPVFDELDPLLTPANSPSCGKWMTHDREMFRQSRRLHGDGRSRWWVVSSGSLAVSEKGLTILLNRKLLLLSVEDCPRFSTWLVAPVLRLTSRSLSQSRFVSSEIVCLSKLNRDWRGCLDSKIDADLWPTNYELSH